MNQIKIGKFIAECRKKNNLTQMQLAEKLNITDRAISKWENGKGMPDSLIMLALCHELKISVNELLSGEVLEMNNYNENLEKNLINMVKEKEENDKKMLTMEIVTGVASITIYLILVIVGCFAEMSEYVRLLITIPSTIFMLVVCLLLLKIEQTAGYYECQKCQYKYVPIYSSVFWAMHINRTRYMKCPKCNQKSWQKKLISK